MSKPGKRKRTGGNDDSESLSSVQSAFAGKEVITDRAKERLTLLEPSDGDRQTGYLDFTSMNLKPDHECRPLWVCPNGRIFLEAFNPMYKQAYDFLVAISEPVARPEFVHEYKLTPYSLYAAVAVAITTDAILSVLERLSKTWLPESVKTFVRDCTLKYGKAKLVLKKNKYYIESAHPSVLKDLLKNKVIREARIKETALAEDEEEEEGFRVSQAPQEMDANLEFQKITMGGDDDDDDPDVIAGTALTTSVRNVTFQIAQDKMEDVKRESINMDYPLMEEYDFRHDNHNPSLKIDLKPTTKIRIYQEKSLSKMFGNGRARSGIIVLPCGAGKTLTGVTAASTVKKSTLVLTTSAVSVEQWRQQFKMWCDLDDKHICQFTADKKEEMHPKVGILCTTYNMIAFGGKRSHESERTIRKIKEREWGIMILDEVHVVPAKMFRKVLSICNAHTKLGLTATLVREDGLIEDLNFLIGPKLYEANWMDLTQAGFLANVQCIEVWCQMTPEFYREYLKADRSQLKQLLYCANPSKFRACEFLKKYHEQRGDKIIIFSDNVHILKKYSELLMIPCIYGATNEKERQKILGAFRVSPVVNCIGLSKVGDVAIDIPDANVIIQVSSHFGARRQEAQRLGRILRPKSTTTEGFNAFFYTLVSTDTQEMFYSTKRQQYLVDQGYTFKVVDDLSTVIRDQLHDSKMGTKKQELDILRDILVTDSAAEEEAEENFLNKDSDFVELQKQAKVRRNVGSISKLSGADGGTRYYEYKGGSSSGGGGGSSGPRHSLFKKRYKNIR
mmetsp:Transcript_15981/g.20475  ORF Transcript_15981/g.20475 Transcript_15981/m.20475 type:complete len:787 (+) Transcript_15981:176-2536(+)